MAISDNNDLHQAVRELVDAIYESLPDCQWCGALCPDDADLLLTRITTFVTEQVAVERERAARIAETKWHEWSAISDRYYKEGDKENAFIYVGWANGASAIEQAIRKGDTNQ